MAICWGWWKASKHQWMTLEVPLTQSLGTAESMVPELWEEHVSHPHPHGVKLETAGPVLLGWKAIPWPANASCFPNTVELEEAQGIWDLALNITPGLVASAEQDSQISTVWVHWMSFLCWGPETHRAPTHLGEKCIKFRPPLCSPPLPPPGHWANVHWIFGGVWPLFTQRISELCKALGSSPAFFRRVITFSPALLSLPLHRD